MFRSLHMKLVLVFILLIISVMTVMGTFFLNSVTGYYIEEFRQQMSQVFTPKTISDLASAAEGENGEQAVREILEAFSLQLGINANRSYMIHDGATGAFLLGTGEGGRVTSPNMLTALSGSVGQEVERLGEYFDVAIPIITAGSTVPKYIVSVRDNKSELNDLSWNLFNILVTTMLFGLVAAIMLSFLLSKTITRPVERLTSQAAKIASGDFGEKAEVHSSDEIGVLTETFNDMATVLETTLKEVEEERDKLDTLFQHMADGVVAFDRTGRLIHMNPAASGMLGKEPDFTATYRQVFPNLQVSEEDMEREQEKYIEVDYAASGRILKILFAPFGRGEEEGGLMAVIQDITQQQKLEESRREFISNVSHELRTPLTNIKGYTETLLDSAGDIDEETARQFLSVVHSEADRMTRIVKDLLTLSRMDYDRMEMKMEPVSLTDLAQDSVHAMELESQNRDIRLVNTIKEALPPVFADRERITQVLVNIIANAIKYNRPGGLVELSGSFDEKRVYIRIKDTGMGIPKADLPRVFERFYRVDKARSRERGGTGLGLPIAKQIVEIHGGKITLTSEENVGSEVVIALPRMKDGPGEQDA